jgi:hypothetical protein
MELLRSTSPVEVVDDAVPAEDIEMEGRGDAGADPQSVPARTRKRTRSAPAGKMKSRNIRLSDDVHDRLWMLSRQRKQSLSAIADDLLNKALPRWEVKRQG